MIRSYLKSRKERKARHVADVYQNQLHPELYLKMERELKLQPFKTVLEILGLLAATAMFAFAGYALLAIA